MDYDTLLSEYEKKNKIEYIKAILSGSREKEILRQIEEKKRKLGVYALVSLLMKWRHLLI